jgi:hypothetical protein
VGPDTMKENLTIEQAQAIGRAAAAQGLKAEDMAFMPKQPKQAKQQSKPKRSGTKPSESQPTQPTPAAPSDAELLAKKKEYDEGRSKWARGELSPAELEALYASYMRSRATFSSQQTIYGNSVPAEDPLPRLNRDLEVAKLERDDCQDKLRAAKQEEQKLKNEKSSSPDVRVAAISSLALDILHDINDARSIPSLSVKASLAEDLVKNLENQLRVARREN